jgi:hypothetical protein
VRFLRLKRRQSMASYDLDSNKIHENRSISFSIMEGQAVQLGVYRLPKIVVSSMLD